MQAATKHRRPVSVGRRARMLDRRNGLLTLLGNLPFRQMVTAAVGNIVVSLLRITFFLLAKRLTAAAGRDGGADLGAVPSVQADQHAPAPGRAAAGPPTAGSGPTCPPGRSVRRLVEFAMSAMSKSQTDTAGAHHASVDPTDDDSHARSTTASAGGC